VPDGTIYIFKYNLGEGKEIGDVTKQRSQSATSYYHSYELFSMTHVWVMLTLNKLLGIRHVY